MAQFLTNFSTVNAVFTAKLTGSIGPKIAGAVLPLGFNPQYLPELIGGLASNNETAIGLVPGVTPAIIGAGVGGLLEAYATGFRFVWISAGCFVVVAWISKSSINSNQRMRVEKPMLIYCCTASWLLVDPTKEFNMHIDAPAEKEEDLYSNRS